MNKNITQLLQQLAGIWKQLGLNQRISITLATLAVLGGLAGVALLVQPPRILPPLRQTGRRGSRQSHCRPG